MHNGEIGARVRASLSGRSQREVAALVNMTPDAFSRALSGQRAFSALELVELSGVLGRSVHWFVTGQEDPQAPLIAARHTFNPETGHRAVPDPANDKTILDGIALAYRQVASELPAGPDEIPSSAADVRRDLGEDFVRPFAERIESRLGVDVVRISGLSTDYSIRVAQRWVIVLAATGNWFRENWSLAHELGHIARRHLGPTADAGDEATANAFAADLLLPADEVTGESWEVPAARVAQFVWEHGISTEALGRRLAKLRVDVPDHVAQCLSLPTQTLLRRHWEGCGARDEITLRMDAASQRRFPIGLQEAHLDAVATGRIGKETLAWMLGVQPDELEVEAPPPESMSTEELAAALGL